MRQSGEVHQEESVEGCVSMLILDHLGSCGCVSVGGNFVIKAGEGAPPFGNEEITKINNWRFRPVMGDVGLL